MRMRLLLVLAVPYALGCGGGATPEETARKKPDPDRCSACHMGEFRAAKDPPHVGARPTTCPVCHTQERWRPSVLDHPYWALTGAHEKAACTYCHGDAYRFRGTPKACDACHRPEYEKAPRHVTLAFPTTCEECHATTAWKPPLEGAKEKAPKPPPPTEPEAPHEPEPVGKATPTSTSERPRTKPPPPRPPTVPTIPPPPDVVKRPSRR